MPCRSRRPGTVVARFIAGEGFAESGRFVATSEKTIHRLLTATNGVPLLNHAEAPPSDHPVGRRLRQFSSGCSDTGPSAWIWSEVRRSGGGYRPRTG